MTPEMKQALLAMLQGGDSPSPGGDLDYEKICEVVKQKMAPSLEMIGAELKALREENDQLKDIVYKMVTSFSDAVGSYKQQGMRTSLMEKFGPDIESIGGFYKDAYDSDITEDLLSALMGHDGDPMEMAGESLGALKQKFAKYLGGTPAPGKEVEAEPDAQGELDLEPPKSEDEPPAEGEKPTEEPEKKEPPGRASDKLFSVVKTLTNRKTA